MKKKKKKNNLKSIKSLRFAPVILLILGDVSLFYKGSDWRTFPIIIFYIFCIIKFKLRANDTFIICLILFLLIYIQYAFSLPAVFESQYPNIPFGEKLAVWLYLFLVVGIIQKWREKPT